MKKIGLALLASIALISCEKSNDDPYNYMKGGIWIAQRVDSPVSDDSVFVIENSYSLEDVGLTDLALSIDLIERNKLLSTSALGEISEYAYGQFGWSSGGILMDSVIYKLEPVIPDASWPTYVDASEYFTIQATTCSTCGDLIEGTLIHKRSKNEMAMLNNKGWIVFTR